MSLLGDGSIHLNYACISVNISIIIFHIYTTISSHLFLLLFSKTFLIYLLLFLTNINCQVGKKKKVI